MMRRDKQEATDPEVYKIPGAFQPGTWVIWSDGKVESIGRVERYTTVKALNFIVLSHVPTRRDAPLRTVTIWVGHIARPVLSADELSAWLARERTKVREAAFIALGEVG